MKRLLVAIMGVMVGATLTGLLVTPGMLGVVILVMFVIGVIAAVGSLIAWMRLGTLTRRHLNNQCLKCGYDLRGGHSKCPECGDVIVEQQVEYWRKHVREE